MIYTFMARQYNTEQNYYYENPDKQISKGWTTHTPIDNRWKTHKIIVGRIIWSISNNDNPYELQIDTKIFDKYITIYCNIHQYISIYVNNFGIVNVDYCIFQILKPINICGNSRMSCETKQTTV